MFQTYDLPTFQIFNDGGAEVDSEVGRVVVSSGLPALCSRLFVWFSAGDQGIER
jgi:hypothetical protein